MNGRVVAPLLLLSFCLALAPAAAEPLLPREARVVEVAPGAPVELTLSAEPWNGSDAWPVLVAGGVLAGGPAHVTLLEGDLEIGAWTWSADAQALSVGTAAVGNASGALTLRLRAEAGTNASVYAYFDAPCGCTSKQAPFPGGVLLFPVRLADGDVARANVSGATDVGATYRVERVEEGGRPLAEVAASAIPAGSAAVDWAAPADGVYALLVTSTDGVGPVSVAFDVVPDTGRAAIAGPALAGVLGALALLARAAPRSRG